MGRYEVLNLENSILVFLDSGLVVFEGEKTVSDFLQGNNLYIAENLLKIVKLYLETEKYEFNKKFEEVRTKALELVNQALEVFDRIAGGSDDM